MKTQNNQIMKYHLPDVHMRSCLMNHDVTDRTVFAGFQILYDTFFAN